MNKILYIIIIAGGLAALPACRKSTSEISEQAQDAINQAEQSLGEAGESLSSMKERVTQLRESVREESARLARIAEEQIALRQKQLEAYEKELDQLAPEARPAAAALVGELKGELEKARLQARKFAEAEPLDNRAQSDELSEMLDRIERGAQELRAKFSQP